ncbi:Hypothetical protein SMAX5B_015756 [Scophthalmus maximus]|uniref:Uncharacterized protein n=1 Tax=Scophthalmus maximus TaxID=52904 RepID=A0A2U9CXY4_SCOMX|nr:Hypothetical protein SMAX5B_015756 [Scophthalmus maximus]
MKTVAVSAGSPALPLIDSNILLITWPLHDLAPDAIVNGSSSRAAFSLSARVQADNHRAFTNRGKRG